MPPAVPPTDPAARPADGVPAGEAARRAAQERATQHVAGLAQRLDPCSFELFLKVLSGLNAAFAQRGRRVELELSPAELELFGPALRAELAVLLEAAGHRPEHVVIRSADHRRDAPLRRAE